MCHVVFIKCQNRPKSIHVKLCLVCEIWVDKWNKQSNLVQWADYVDRRIFEISLSGLLVLKRMLLQIYYKTVIRLNWPLFAMNLTAKLLLFLRKNKGKYTPVKPLCQRQISIVCIFFHEYIVTKFSHKRLINDKCIS